MSDERDLVLDFIGESHTVPEGTALTFGRLADLVVDDANQYLHRVVGRFFSHGDAWWLESLGSHVALDLATADGTVAHLPPCADPDDPPVTIVPRGDFTLTFEAGGFRYQIDGHAPTRPAAAGAEQQLTGPATATFGQVPLTDEERALLVALCRPVLLDPTAGPDDLVPNRELANALGWSVTKFNRKLDYLCTRLTKVGVRGLQGGRGSEATNRRWRLVEHAVASRMITALDLPPGDI